MLDIVELIYEDHDWFRRRFFYLDLATTVADQRAIWEPLATRLDIHAEAEEKIFYPAFLQQGKVGDPEDETEDAIGDHNKIRDAVAKASQHPVGTDAWEKAVAEARKENGEHLEEEEREGLPGFLKSSTAEQRHEMALAWLRFYHEHPPVNSIEEAGIAAEDKDPDEYIAENKSA